MAKQWDTERVVGVSLDDAMVFVDFVRHYHKEEYGKDIDIPTAVGALISALHAIAQKTGTTVSALIGECSSFGIKGE